MRTLMYDRSMSRIIGGHIVQDVARNGPQLECCLERKLAHYPLAVGRWVGASHLDVVPT